MHVHIYQIRSDQLLSRVQLFAAPWTAARQASLSITNSWSLLKLMSIESVMPSNHLILCCPLLLPSVFTSIRVFSDDFSSSHQVAKVLEFQLYLVAFSLFYFSQKIQRRASAFLHQVYINQIEKLI